MSVIKHPLTGVSFEVLPDGLVRVDDPEAGKEGIFRHTGEWVSGALRHADHHMVRWAFDLAAGRANKAMAVAGDRGSDTDSNDEAEAQP